MIKSSKKSSFLLAIILATSPLSILPSIATIRQPVPPSISESQYIALSWSEIWERVKRRRVPGGRRGEPNEQSLCMITPGELVDIENPRNRDSIKMWNPVPLFLWQGTMAGIKVVNTKTGELMWSQTLDPTARSITYGGEPLQPGEAYFWQERLPRERTAENSPSPRVSFRILKAEERDFISTELEKLESKLQAEEASAEDVALARANYFEQKKLSADFFREIYSQASYLSEEISQIESRDFCPDSEEN